MTSLISDQVRSWIGRKAPPVRFEVARRDIVKYAIATEQRLHKYLRGDEAPPMFLFGASLPLTPLADLKIDGLIRDSLTPDLPLKRVMAGGIRQEFNRPVKPGDVLIINRVIDNIYEKSGASGPLIFVVYVLTVTTESGEMVLRETQTRIQR